MSHASLQTRLSALEAGTQQQLHSDLGIRDYGEYYRKLQPFTYQHGTLTGELLPELEVPPKYTREQFEALHWISPLHQWFVISDERDRREHGATDKHAFELALFTYALEGLDTRHARTRCIQRALTYSGASTCFDGFDFDDYTDAAEFTLRAVLWHSPFFAQVLNTPAAIQAINKNTLAREATA